MLKATNIGSLPDEIIFEILVRLPARDIYNAAKLVCPKWYQMVRTRDFVRAHLQQSTCGLLIQELGSKRDRPGFVTTQKGGIEISNFDYKFTRNVLSSCNGLTLEYHAMNHRNLYIANPATKQHFALPPFLTNIIHCGYAIAYASTSMEYKVVHTFYDNSSNSEVCAILTVGVDKDWTRRVNTQHLSLAAKNLLRQCPLTTTKGFMHWARDDSRSEFILTLNVETEIITESHIPSCICRGETKYLLCHYIPMGSYLSLLIARSYFSWEAWKMKPETGEWTKMPSIDLEPRKCRLED